MMSAPDPIDIHVGNRLRIRRLWVGLTLTAVADALGIRHQQIQKYENAQNKIGASRLYALSQALDVPIEYFFEDLSSSDTPSISGVADLERSGFLHEFLSNQDMVALNRAFVAIEDKRVRRSLINIVRMFAD